MDQMNIQTEPIEDLPLSNFKTDHFSLRKLGK
jgi:hypothetical protein